MCCVYSFSFAIEQLGFLQRNNRNCYIQSALWVYGLYLHRFNQLYTKNTWKNTVSEDWGYSSVGTVLASMHKALGSMLSTT